MPADCATIEPADQVAQLATQLTADGASLESTIGTTVKSAVEPSDWVSEHSAVG